jgi:hypothetical protein
VQTASLAVLVLSLVVLAGLALAVLGRLFRQ